jgi:tetratricopeptide (TPR) repeat protein
LVLSSCSKFALGLASALFLQGADSPAVLFSRASAALEAQQYPEAEAGFEAVLKAEPHNIGALGNLGVVYSKTHRYAQAIGVYKSALKAAPRDKSLLTNLGLAYVKQEQYTPAAAIFESLAADPANLQARELLASCRLSLGQYESALTVLSQLTAAEPLNPGPFYMQGIAFTRLKRKAEAQAAFTAMMNAANPAHASFLMGKASYETGDFEQAAKYLRQSLTADPSLEGAHRELGKALTSLRRDDEAEAELRKAGADDPEALYFLGALFSHNRQQEALPLLARAHSLTPDFWGPLYYLGRLAVEQHRPADAVEFLKRATLLKPEEPAIQYQLAKAFQQQGKQAEAQAAFARVKELKSRSLQTEIGILTSER